MNISKTLFYDLSRPGKISTRTKQPHTHLTTLKALPLHRLHRFRRTTRSLTKSIRPSRADIFSASSKSLNRSNSSNCSWKLRNRLLKTVASFEAWSNFRSLSERTWPVEIVRRPRKFWSIAMDFNLKTNSKPLQFFLQNRYQTDSNASAFGSAYDDT